MKASEYIKESETVAVLLQGSKWLAVFTGLSFLQDPNFNRLNDALGTAALAGLLINAYRNKDRDWRKIVRNEHRAKRQLKKVGSALDKAEDETERLMHPVVEDLRVLYKILSVHEFTNGFHRHSGEEDQPQA